MELFTPGMVQNPNDISYRMNRQRMIQELCKLSVNQLDMQIQYQMRQKPSADASAFETTKSIVGDIYSAPYTPSSVKGLLDSTGGTTGNVLVRQDLEAPKR